MALIARRIAENVGRTEGPVHLSTGEILFVGMTHGCVYALDAGRVGVHARVGLRPNGAAEGLDGSVYITQGGGVRKHPDYGTGGIQKIDRDRSVSWVTRDPISPNDLCFGPDGFLYFTDPTRPRAAEDDGRLFRCHVGTGETELLCSVPWYPNGIGFGPDDALYVARYSKTEPSIMRYSIDAGRLRSGEPIVRMKEGHRPDGFAFDTTGNLIIGANSDCEEPGQIQTYGPDGKLLDVFVPGPEKHYTNVALSSEGRLIITDTDGEAVLAVDDWPGAGLKLYPFRR